jgi:predicted DNA binding CopG/RHH family protein
MVDKKKKAKDKEIRDYDDTDTSEMINPKRKLAFEDLGLKLPELPPTQVISIRLPTELLNQIKAIGSQEDVPYQALIKLFLSDAVKKKKDKSA